MLSRRFLRIKVMQAAFSYQIAQQAQQELILAEIEDHFAPDLNSMVPQDKELLTSQATTAKKLFQDSFPEQVLLRSENEEVDEIVNKKIKEYYTNEKGIKQSIRKNILSDISLTYKNFLFILSIPSYFPDYIRKRESKEKSMKVSSLGFFNQEYTIEKNTFFDALINNDFLKKELEKEKVNKPDPLLIKKVYLDCLENEQYKNYLKGEEDEEEDIKVMKKVYKIIFKNDFVKTELSEKDINWLENAEVIKGLCQKILKSNLEDLKSKDLFTNIIKDEDDDFWKALYDQTLEKDVYIQTIITEKLKNWDLERVTLTDRIILKMAIQEMLNHSSIPVKVTINEYIELSKKYSTPKSKQFVNGILDKLSKELTEKGKIKKSGRGLIDNK